MWLYRWFMRLSPEALRREYGAAMEEMFARRLTDARDATAWRRAHLWGRELAGLLALAASERYGRAARLRRDRERRLARPKAGVMDTTAQENTKLVLAIVRRVETRLRSMRGSVAISDGGLIPRGSLT